jgi:dienelactone hydrolase
MAQKRLIDNETYKTWTTLQKYNISNDGKYTWYEYGTESSPGSLVVCSTDGKYKREFSGARNATFTGDGHRLIFDSPSGFAILEMSKDSVQYIDHGDFSIPKDGNGRWLSYHIDSSIILKDMDSHKERKYTNATATWFNVQGTVLLVQTPTALLWVSLPDGKDRIILQGTTTNNITFDATGTRIAFITSGPQGNVLRYYQPGMDSAAIHITGNAPGIRHGLTISDEVPQFSQDGLQIFFKLDAGKTAATIPHDSTIITDKVEVWHYKDRYLLSQQLEELPRLKNRTYTAATSINTGKVVQLESGDTKLIWPSGNKYALISNIVNDIESYWNKDEIANYQLASLLNGNRKSILSDLHTIYFCQMSPGEQFVTWYDPMKKNHFSYEVATGITRNITQAVKAPIYNDDHHLPTQDLPFGIAGWLAGDRALLIYDRYDIWQVDPMNKKQPVNITGGYGRLHKIIFRVITDNSRLVTTDTLLLTALNRDNKYNGFWKKKQGTSAAPIPCGDMAPFLYYFPGTDFNARPPIKAKNAPAYLVQRMSATDAPNLFATTDFHSFIPLSDIHPQKEYNWMTTELIHWKMPDGQTGEGILYKPENFDPRKKYPLIFYYYEKRSNELFAFRKPALSNGTLNISWFVSNGYLVCLPDIYYTIGHTGQSVVNSVESAAKYLSTRPWVDATKMGLQGHSFGGYETNYLVTHSTLFVAAQESAGMSDMISWYGGLAFGGLSTAFQCETGHSNLHTTPWQQPDIYVENSPVFSMDKVKTPLLILHNKGDGAVPFAHALEMFTALRRLQKPVWLLQYDGEDHTLTNPACRLDFSIRQQQFFNHYLKGFTAAEWMTKGISAERKGIESGIRLDRSLNTAEATP